MEIDVLKIYNVYAGRLHIDMIYAYSKEQACDMVNKKWGDPRTYTTTSDGSYCAEEA